MPYESDPLTSKLNELIHSQGPPMGLLFFDELNPAERALFGTWELTNEVYNGGFLQYFHNSCREHAKPMVMILTGIGAAKAADLLDSAIALAGPGTRWGDEPDYRVVVSSMPEEMQDRLGALADQFFDQSDDMHLKLFQYLSKHRDQIDAPDEFCEDAKQ